MAKSSAYNPSETDRLLRQRFDEMKKALDDVEKKVASMKAERERLCVEHEKFYLDQIKPLTDKIRAIEEEHDYVGMRQEYGRLARALPGARSTSDNIA